MFDFMSCDFNPNLKKMLRNKKVSSLNCGIHLIFLFLIGKVRKQDYLISKILSSLHILQF